MRLAGGCLAGIIVGIVGFVLILVLISGGSSTSTGPSVSSDQISANKKEWARNFAATEPQVVEAAWSMETVLWIGMWNDGTARSGFAQYTCEMLRLGGITNVVRIKVVDEGKANRDELEFIGQYDCRL